MKKPKVLTIIGPTASGKTELSYRIARELEHKTGKKIEIISADSRQIYKHIPISTAQPPKEYLKKYKHHFINSLELTDEFSAGTFGKMARELISFIFHKGGIPIVVGGSGLYLRSLIYGLFDADDIIEEEHGRKKQKKIRNELGKRLENEGIEKLTAELNAIDRATIDQMDHVTERRILRALEVYYLTGLPLSILKNRIVEIKFDFVQIGISLDRQILYDKINCRVDKMLETGLVEEVNTLKEKGFDPKKDNSLNTVGVKEVFDYLEGRIVRDEMSELIKRNTRHYAKRQMTWFNKDKNIKWVKDESEIIGQANMIFLNWL